MNLKKLFGIILAIMAQTTLIACPTCVGRVTKKSEPFFSLGFYKPTTTCKQESKNAPRSCSAIPLKQEKR